MLKIVEVNFDSDKCSSNKANIRTSFILVNMLKLQWPIDYLSIK